MILKFFEIFENLFDYIIIIKIIIFYFTICISDLSSTSIPASVYQSTNNIPTRVTPSTTTTTRFSYLSTRSLPSSIYQSNSPICKLNKFLTVVFQGEFSKRCATKKLMVEIFQTPQGLSKMEYQKIFCMALFEKWSIVAIFS